MAAAITAAGSVYGASPSYTGANAGNWNVGSNWSTGIAPVNGDTVSIGGFNPARTGQSIYVTFNATNLSGTGLSSLTLDSANCQEEYLLINGAGGSLIAANETIGNVTQLNEVDQTAGSNVVGSTLNIGNTNSSGVYNLSGTGTLSAALLEVSNGGLGSFTQTGGTVTLSSALVIGQLASASGSYTLSGTAVLNAASEITADNGTTGSQVDYFYQTGGTNNVTGINGLTVGSNGTSVYNLSSGTLNVNGPTSTETLGYGGNGNGTLLQYNGSNYATTLQLGMLTGQGFYNLQGGTLSTTNGAQQIGSGTFTQLGGVNQLFTSSLTVGERAGATGNYLLQAGFLNLSNASEYIGNGGTGNFTQVSGTNLISNAGSLYVGGYNISSAGNYALQGGVLSIAAGFETVGYKGTGSFTQSGSSTNTVTSGNIYIGYLPGSTGTYLLQSGTLNAQTVAVGFDGTGTFNQSGGTVNLSDGIYLAADQTGTGTYIFGGGTINANTELVGTLATTGSFIQNGGVNNVTDKFEIAQFYGQSVGSYTLNAGTLNILNQVDEVIGSDGTATFTQNGGVNSVTGRLLIGTDEFGAPGSLSSYFLTGGTLVAYGGEFLADGNYGVFFQSGGTNNISSPGLGIGGYGLPAAYNLSLGTLNTPTINVDYQSRLSISGGVANVGSLYIRPPVQLSSGTISNPGGTLNLTGGILNIVSLNTAGNPASFSWTGGTLGFTAGVTFDPGAGPTTTAGAFGSSLVLNNNMNLVVFGSETVGGIAPFTLTLNAGSADDTSGILTIAPAGTVIQNGGSIASYVFNLGTFDYFGGTFNSGLNNQGTANFLAPATITEGGSNSGDLNLLNISATLTLNTLFVNTGSVTMAGGGIVGLGIVSNSGLISGYGQITGASLINTGVITQSGGNLQLNSGTGVFNTSGTINLTSGLTLSIVGPGTINDGTINLNSGTLSLQNTLTNNADGAISGPGKIVGTFVNNGTLDVPNGSTTTGSFTNTGVIEMSGPAAVLGSGATITNSNTIEGYGKISDTVINNGTIQPTAGTLTFTAPVTDSASGMISIPAGSKALMQGVTTFPANAGLINLVGGTFDNGGNSLTNNGSILGYGILSTGGTGLTNNGAITFTGGTTTVNGNVTNNTSKTINIKYQPAIFTGNLTNNVQATINTISTTFTVAGNFTNNGTYNSDPATTIFQSNVASGGTINGVTGDQYIFYGGTFTNTGSFLNAGSIQSSDPTFNSGIFTQTGPQNWAVGTTFNNTAGTATFGSDAGGGGANLIVNALGGTTVFSTTQHLASLTVSTGATATVTGGGNSHRSIVFTPSLAVTGTLDLTANDLDVQAGNLAAITSLVKQGYNSGSWTGSGVLSSTAAGDPSHLTALGVILNVVTGTTPLYTNFDGAPVAGNDVLVKYTYYGDTNLDGKVDGTDYSRIDSAYQADRSNPTIATGWYNGDFNYDGAIDGSDYTLIDNTFNTQGVQLDASVATQLGGTSAVPEPGCIAVGSLLTLGLLTRRRAVRRS